MDRAEAEELVDQFAKALFWQGYAQGSLSAYETEKEKTQRKALIETVTDALCTQTALADLVWRKG